MSAERWVGPSPPGTQHRAGQGRLLDKEEGLPWKYSPGIWGLEISQGGGDAGQGRGGMSTMSRPSSGPTCCVTLSNALDLSGLFHTPGSGGGGRSPRLKMRPPGGLCPSLNPKSPGRAKHSHFRNQQTALPQAWQLGHLSGSGPEKMTFGKSGAQGVPSQ